MNLTVNDYKITLGPRALAHVETMKSPYFEDAAKVYAQNELERWCAGGKVGPDVTISGPERFVPRYNELGLPMMPKAGAEACERAERETGSTEPLPVASAAPVDSEWPKFKHYKKAMLDGSDTLAVMLSETDGGVLYRRGGKITQGFTWASRTHGNEIKLPEALAFLRANGHAKVADELERQAPPEHGLQVWRDESGTLCVVHDGVVAALTIRTGVWTKTCFAFDVEGVTRLVGPEADAAIKEAKKQGVI